MTKKTEDKSLTSNLGHYYLKEQFEKLLEPTYLQKKQTQRIIRPKFKGQVFYTENFTELYSRKDSQLVSERLSWYEAIESGDLKPSIDECGNVRIVSENLKDSLYADWCEKIEVIASQWVERENFNKTQAQEQGNVSLILQALTQLTRYLPELQEQQPNYFLDVETYKIGVTLQGEGTLTLLIGGNSEVEYSYAQRQEKGTIRVSGFAKLTTNIRNSKNIWKLLNLQGIVK